MAVAIADLEPFRSSSLSARITAAGHFDRMIEDLADPTGSTLCWTTLQRCAAVPDVVDPQFPNILQGEPSRSSTRDRKPVVEHVVTDLSETFLWRLDDYPWERNVWNIHPEYEIHLVRNASGIALVGDHIERFEPGYLAIVGSGLPHDWVTAVTPGERIAGRDIVLQFDPARLRNAAVAMPEMMDLEPFLQRALRGLAFHGETRRLGTAYLEAMGDVRGFDRLMLFLRLIQLMAGRGEYRILSSPDFAPPRDDAAQSAVQHVVTYLLHNFTKDVRLPEVARQLDMSDWAFSRFFKKHTGNTFTDYLTALRIGFACKLLSESTLPMTQVCFEAGYANLSNFNRTFRQQRKMTPTAYRRLADQRRSCRVQAFDDPLRPDPSELNNGATQHA